MLDTPQIVQTAARSTHLRMHPDTFDFEIGVPVTEPVAAAGPSLWETYVTDPASWLAELTRPLAE